MPRRNHDRLERLWADHAEDLYSFMLYRTGDRVVAEDLVADTFERVMTSRAPRGDRGASERTWLYAIALNRLRDVARRQSAERRAYEHLDAEPGAPDAFATLADRDAIRKALRMLSDEEQEVVALRFGADLTLEQTAAVLGVARSTVEGRLYRALRRMKTILTHDPTNVTASVGKTAARSSKGHGHG